MTMSAAAAAAPLKAESLAPRVVAELAYLPTSNRPLLSTSVYTDVRSQLAAIKRHPKTATQSRETLGHGRRRDANRILGPDLQKKTLEEILSLS